MNLKRSFPVILAASAMFVPVSSFAQSAQTNARYDELSARIDGIEAKLDALLRMMSEKAADIPNASSMSAAQSTSEQQPQSMPDTAQGLNLDLYVVPADQEGPALEPSGAPAASSIVDGTTFPWAVITEIDSMKRFTSKDAARRVGLYWNGRIRIDAEGEYLFSLDVSIDPVVYFHNTTKCAASIIVDGVKVVTTLAEDNSPTDETVVAEIGKVGLAKGEHAFGLWANCSTESRETTKLERVRFGISMKSPSDRAPKPIDPSLFSVE